MSGSLFLKDHTEERKWWKESVIYQIYPTSFKDSNGDGIGDLNGILDKLDHIKDLGATVIWLSPIYKSPLADMGYDIADYRDIDRRYGTLEDWDRLLKGAHDRGMKLMMDLVVNHTSDEHQWFIESRSSKDDPKRDWYIWRPPRYDSDGNRRPPNNWRSNFEGSAWTFDDKTGEYYLHLWHSKQPDLNWELLEVREAVWDIMRFWLDRGSDGFRMDVINCLSKTKGLPDAPISFPNEEYQPASIYYANGPRIHEFLGEMYEKVLSKYDPITVGETPFTYDSDKLVEYVLPNKNELQMVFPFELMEIDGEKADPTLTSGEVQADQVALVHKDWKLSEFKQIVQKWQLLKMKEGYWNASYIENHDQARSVSRFGNDSTDELRSKSAKLLALFHVTQRGTLYIFQGQELGLKNAPRTWGIEEYLDVATINFWNKILARRRQESGKEDVKMDDILDGIQMKARDHARIPVSWDSSPHGGFTTGKPWMRVNDDYSTWNAAAQVGNEDSVYTFWKRLVQVRKEHDVLIYGDFTLLFPDHEQLFAFTRSLKSGAVALVVMNFSKEPLRFKAPLPKFQMTGGQEFAWDAFKFVLGNSTVPENLLVEGEFIFEPYEGRLYISNSQ
ncbi:glycoside hydrolase family 13 protein [Marasmius fiardii PR-910]|nr:glycoside hydrolase family 13 protein [Marasmius fiardii PR-910]